MSTSDWSELSDRSGKIFNKNLENTEGDQKKYQLICLGNGLKVLVISDPCADRTYASMSIDVGSSISGEQRGLHGPWVHLTCKKIDRDLKKLDGTTRPYVHLTHVKFCFSVNDKNSEDGLKCFSQIFCKPQIDADLILEDLYSVYPNSDDLKDPNRICRIQQITSFPEHPWGPNPPRREMNIGAAPGDIFNEVEKFHEDHILANNMALCVLRKEPLTDSVALVGRIFSEIPKKNVEIPASNTHPLSNEVSREILTKTMEEISLELVFPTPDHSENDELNMLYLGKFICNYNEWKSSNPMFNISWFCGRIKAERNSEFKNGTFFSVNIPLTEEGLKDYKKVLYCFFTLLVDTRKNGIASKYFEQTEQFLKEDEEFKLQYVGNQAERVRLAKDPRRIICDKKVNPNLDKETIDKHLKMICVENCSAYLSAPYFPFETDMVEEEKSGIEYQIRPFSNWVKKGIKSYAANSGM